MAPTTARYMYVAKKLAKRSKYDNDKNNLLGSADCVEQPFFRLLSRGSKLLLTPFLKTLCAVPLLY